MNDIRVLLVESDIGAAQFIQEALTEISETTHDGSWIHCRVDHCECASDAVLVLENDRPDVILFNPTGQAALQSFSALKDAAGPVPLIALLDRGNESLGRRLLRQGAQDYILKSEIECGPLARAMLNAIDRQRYFVANHAVRK